MLDLDAARVEAVEHNDNGTAHTRSAVRETKVGYRARLSKRMLINGACVRKRLRGNSYH